MYEGTPACGRRADTNKHLSGVLLSCNIQCPEQGSENWDKNTFNYDAFLFTDTRVGTQDGYKYMYVYVSVFDLMN